MKKERYEYRTDFGGGDGDNRTVPNGRVLPPTTQQLARNMRRAGLKEKLGLPPDKGSEGYGRRVR